MKLTPEHEELKRTIERFVEQELNPHVDEWEEAGIFPAHLVFGKLGELGLLGLTKPCADLSRGASEEDILGVAAIIGLQAIEFRKLYPTES